MYGIRHPVQQLYFDRAVWVFGSSLESDLEKATADMKRPKPKQQEAARMRVLQKWLGTDTFGYRQVQVTKG